MVLDIVPNRFWTFPATRWFNWDDDEFTSSTPTGLSIYEDDNNVYVEAALPGIDPKNIEVTFDKGMLWIKGETKDEEENKQKKYYRKATNSFSYRVALPGEVDTNSEPDASCKNGIMTVTFSKSPQSQPKKITVKAGK